MNEYSEELVFIRANTKLTEVPEIGPDIKCVDLHKNLLKTIKFSPTNAIEYLDLSDNHIEDIRPINSAPAVRVVDCSYNLVKAIPSLVLPELRELYLIANDIELIENIAFGGLVKLDLAANDIRAIGSICTERLEELYLATNKIEIVENLSHLPCLRILDLQYNRITELDCTVLPSSLEVLLLQGNSFLRKISNIGHLTRLKMINYKGTRIERLKVGSDVVVW